MIIQIPAINGLGATEGCELAPKLICNMFNLKSKSILINKSNLDEQELKIYSKILQVLRISKEEVIVIGGDHSISFPIGKAFLENTQNPKILIFDAHLDLMKPMKNPTHEEWLRALIENKNFKDILIVGVRRDSKNIDKREVEFARKKSIKIIYSDEFDTRKEEILDFCKNHEIYISLDVDVFDESILDSTNYPEKSGLNKNLVELIKKIENVKILDLVEINPIKGDFQKALPLIKKILR